MPAILDRQNGRRYGRVQFINEVIDFITTAEGRRPCYDLLDGLQKRQAGQEAVVSSIVLTDEPGVPQHLRGSSYELVNEASDAEKFDREWRAAKYLRPLEAAALLRVDSRTVKRWAQHGKLDGFRTPGGHWRIDEEAVRRMRHGDQPTRVEKGRMVTGGAVAEVDLGPCAMCADPILAGEEYVSVIEASLDGTITSVSNRHAACQPTEHDGPAA
jgi:excisionase family DNA binding protein